MENKNNKNQILWGLFFLVGAAALILGKLDIFPSISVFEIFFSIILIWIFLHGLRHRSFFAVFMSLAFLVCLYNDKLRITTLTPLTILCAALLASIGLEIIFHKNRNYFTHKKRLPEEKNMNSAACGEHIAIEENFVSTTKYITSEHLIDAKIEMNFGEMQVYLDNAVLANKTASLHVNVSFGNMVLYVPSSWKVINYATASFGSITEKNSSYSNSDSPVLNLYGDVAFGGLEIFYI